MQTLKLLSGRRLKRLNDLSSLPISELRSFAVINAKNVANDRGDVTSHRQIKIVPFDQCLVAEVDAKDFSIRNILQSGSIPQIVSPTGSFDRLQTSLAAQRYLGSIDESQLQNSVINEHSE